MPAMSLWWMPLPAGSAALTAIPETLSRTVFSATLMIAPVDLSAMAAPSLALL
ncbi:MAG: hypothetical protein ACHQ4H_11230 [Ktedonobacterales bacterium]